MKQRPRPTREVLAAMVAQAPAMIVPPPPSGGPASPRSSTVRFTFDVPRSQHRYIKHFVLEAETTGSQATRALWDLVQEDPQLAHRLRSALSCATPIHE